MGNETALSGKVALIIGGGVSLTPVSPTKKNNQGDDIDHK